jgi:hypothetical protein
MASEKQEFNRLTKKVTRVLNKDLELSDLDISAIKNISKAKNMDEVNFLAFQHFERLYSRLFSKVS